MRKILVRTLLSLPGRWLVALSGGKPLTIEGRTLDPRLQFLGAMAKRQPSLATLAAVEGRKAAAEGLALVDGEAAHDIEIANILIPGPDGTTMRARTYKPRLPNRLVPALVYFHMGGCVIGDLETCHVFCSLIALRAGCLVVSVDYRLAPEHKYPAAVEDALAAFRWVRENARALGGNPNVVAVGGDSAGGYLSAVIAQELKRANEKPPVLQMLIYPAVDWLSQTQSMKSFGDAYPLTTPIMDYFRMQYFSKPDEEAKELRASPGLAADLSGLPPALIYTAGHDPLVDQGRDYAEALKVAGVPVLYRCYDSLSHAFTAMSGAVPAARNALLEIVADLRRAMG
ncbi:MAG: alpha/beta hydrolase [Alphaproteobacteria bacterium]|nr:alpha/beta hydrolase [Alphaproteobacteria bacterium]